MPLEPLKRPACLLYYLWRTSSVLSQHSSLDESFQSPVGVYGRFLMMVCQIYLARHYFKASRLARAIASSMDGSYVRSCSSCTELVLQDLVDDAARRVRLTHWRKRCAFDAHTDCHY
jgi:hypothetical protein